MLWGNRKTGPTAPKRNVKTFRPFSLELETRVLMAINPTNDLINIDGSQVSTTNQGPYGVLLAGTPASTTGAYNGAGFSVANAGDVNRDGFDDILVGEPKIANSVNGNLPVLSPGAGRAYLIFGSKSVTVTSVTNWLAIQPTQGNQIPVNPSPTQEPFNGRDGDLGALGNATSQTNPVTNIPGSPQTPSFFFDGLTIVSSDPTMTSANLGAAVAGVGDVNGDGFADFMVGAPGANGNAGRAFLIYGSSTIGNATTRQLDLNAPNGVLVDTFNGPSGSQTGRSLANVGGFIKDNSNPNSIAIGAPNASISSPNSGAVFIVSGRELQFNPGGLTFNLANLRLNNTGGVTSPIGTIIAGANSGDQLGFSVAGPGDVTSNTNTNQAILIGAPAGGNGTTGSAYLIYAAQPNTLLAATTATNFIPVTGLGASPLLPGAVFTGVNPGDLTGYAVAGIGDFNGDGIPDFAIGSPGYDLGLSSLTTFDGRTDVIFGGPAANRLGAFTFATVESSTAATGVGFFSSTNDAMGFSIGGVGTLNQDAMNELLIGAPGNGLVYLVAGSNGLTPTGTVPFYSVASPTLSGPLINYSFFQSQSPTLSYFGSSVAGLKNLNNPSKFDSDGIPDFVIGAAGLNATQRTSSVNAGGVYVIEGGLKIFQIATPTSGTNPPPPPPPVGGGGSFSNRNLLLNASAVPEFGESLLPTPATLSRLRWKALPKRVAFKQFLPSRPFANRYNQFFHPTHQKPLGSAKRYSGYRTSTLGQAVFTRGQFPTGVHFGQIKHKGATIPQQH